MNSSKNQDSIKKLINISVGDLIAVVGVIITIFSIGSQLFYSFYQNGRMMYYGIPYFKIIQTNSQTWFFINIFFIILFFFIQFYITRRTYLQKRKQDRSFTHLEICYFAEFVFVVFMIITYLNITNLSLFNIIISSFLIVIIQILTNFICNRFIFQSIIKNKKRQDQLEYYIKKHMNVVVMFLTTLLTTGVILIVMTGSGYTEEAFKSSYYITQDNGIDQVVVQTIDHKAILFDFKTNNNTLIIDKSKFKIIDMTNITLEEKYYPNKIFYNN